MHCAASIGGLQCDPRSVVSRYWDAKEQTQHVDPYSRVGVAADC